MSDDKKEQPKTDYKKHPIPADTQAKREIPDPKQNAKPQIMKFSEDYKEQ